MKEIDWDEKQQVLEAVKEDDYFFSDNAPFKIKNDEKYLCELMEFLESEGMIALFIYDIFPYLSRNVLAKKDFVIKCLRAGCSLEYVSVVLRNHSEVVRNAILNNSLNIDFVSERIKKISEGESVLRAIEEADKRQIPF